MITFGLVGEPTTLDPYSQRASLATYALATPLWPSLFARSSGGRPRPQLAASMRASDDRARIELRDVSWSDGSPITANDVVASVGRARHPSGLAGLTARAISSAVVVLRGFRGPVSRWRKRLSKGAFILPEGRVRRDLSGGPFRIAARTPGLGLTLRRNRGWWGRAAFVDAIRVRYVEGLDMLLSLLETRRIDVAAPPSSVNLKDRLEGLGVAVSRRPGGEMLLVQTTDRLPSQYLRWIRGAIDREAVEQGLLREDGEVLFPRPGLQPRGRRPASLVLAAPSGDELAGLVQRVFYQHLGERDVEVELVSVDERTFYGQWATGTSADVTIARTARAVRRSSRRVLAAGVATFLASQPEIRGPDAVPALPGPLWNAARWWKLRG